MTAKSNVLSAILEVFNQISTWIATAVTNIMPMFYTTEGLTMLGVLAVAGLAFSVVFLVSSVARANGNVSTNQVGEFGGHPI